MIVFVTFCGHNKTLKEMSPHQKCDVFRRGIVSSDDPQNMSIRSYLLHFFTCSLVTTSWRRHPLGWNRRYLEDLERVQRIPKIWDSYLLWNMIIFCHFFCHFFCHNKTLKEMSSHQKCDVFRRGRVCSDDPQIMSIRSYLLHFFTCSLAMTSWRRHPQ